MPLNIFFVSKHSWIQSIGSLPTVTGDNHKLHTAEELNNVKNVELVG